MNNRLPKVSELSLEQRRFIDLKNSLCLITGANKSGKTLVLLYKAKQLEYTNQPYTFIVHTNVYKSFIKHAFAEIGLTKGRIMTFWEWKNKGPHPQQSCLLIDDIDIFFDLTEEDVEDFKNHTNGCVYATMLNKHRVDGSLPTYNYLRKAGFKELPLFFSHSHFSKFISYFSLDNQEKYVSLQRNTTNLPKIIVCDDDTNEILAIKQCTEKLFICEYSCAILVKTRDMVARVAQQLIDMNIRCEVDRQINFASCLPKVMTMAQAIGLEFDSVICLVDDTIDDFYKEYYERALHCANSELIFISRKAIPSCFSSIPSSQYKLHHNTITYDTFKL